MVLQLFLSFSYPYNAGKGRCKETSLCITPTDLRLHPFGLDSSIP